MRYFNKRRRKEVQILNYFLIREAPYKEYLEEIPKFRTFKTLNEIYICAKLEVGEGHII